MPGLDLLAEDQAEGSRVFLLDERGDGGVDCAEHLQGEGADVVEVWGGGGKRALMSGWIEMGEVRRGGEVTYRSRGCAGRGGRSGRRRRGVGRRTWVGGPW